MNIERIRIYTKTLNECINHIENLFCEVQEKKNIKLEDIEELEFLYFTKSVIDDFIEYLEQTKMNME
jgi:hypothetical protein